MKPSLGLNKKTGFDHEKLQKKAYNAKSGRTKNRKSG